jgi:non-specific riboncleoside hydrolase
MADRIPVVIDTDPGIDDAAALAVALFSPALDVRLITTVAGNVSIDKTTRNALRLESFLGTHVPVARGASRPLAGIGIEAGAIHGESGLGDWDYDMTADELLLEEGAVEALWDSVSEAPGSVTVITLGPLTNLAQLLRDHPDLPRVVRRVVCMGGAIRHGNVGVLSEFNVAVDPVAAREVVASNLDVTFVPLEVADKALVMPDGMARIAAGSRMGAVLAEMFDVYVSRPEVSVGKEMYDPTAVGYVIAPEMYHVVDCFLEVDAAACCSAGGTYFDLDGLRGHAPNVHVATSIDADAFRVWFEGSLALCP